MYLNWMNNILEGLKDTYATNNIYDLYDYLEIKIIKLEPSNILLRGNESLYNRNYFGNEIVLIRNDLILEYEKFILAHELGHALLHTETYKAAFNKNLINCGKLEKQANYFAFKLLALDLDPIAFDGFTIEQIASSLYLPKDCFNVTNENIAI
ncbi:TPA: ImmA/IrrE family metallo-endopeptidase [Clostridium botulinum]|uniref:ImmA/IrrE family metallo-endopeptidase n=1 Tax=Clostridium botulinum TaxID=1491 RepID=UPI0029A00BDF|nr:ImmA/IrrE family metallo-endopeptidase [Clostridium botulinum]HDK7188758.1 ImmA/IrrE family metallo-endopeptidase [Clostridium botulinum]HDK7215677.1 ImmA/IrrE family metallo-endopeptidase [Clostridium botulinum]HDK7231431.1 ImmA/IrrE family metallo-endopeptidase [Clostridium botulinum]HDK7261181.1 ImmA/IrrE family metallo-endopeptidase [Clostridium botulinum]